MYGLEVQKVNLNNGLERQEVEKFLQKFGLILDKDVDYTVIMSDNNEIKATCSKARNVLKCFAVDTDMRGEGITATLISHLIDKLFEQGIYHNFIFTKPDNIPIFSSLNYKLIHQVKNVSLLENGIYDINSYLDKFAQKYSVKNNEKAAIVMNCNPFTLGHKYLIEKAASENDEVLVFIVEEDRSLFPFDVRYKLVKEGTEHLKNVKVIPGGEYIISSATFPAYFLREESTRLKAYTELDAGIFAKYFCQRLNIKRRYVGNEPYCNVTNAYNETLKEVLKQHGIELCVVQRKNYREHEISASKVRSLIKEGRLEELKHILPSETLNFLNSENGKEIAERIKVSKTPH